MHQKNNEFQTRSFLARFLLYGGAIAVATKFTHRFNALIT